MDWKLQTVIFIQGLVVIACFLKLERKYLGQVHQYGSRRRVTNWKVRNTSKSLCQKYSLIIRIYLVNVNKPSVSSSRFLNGKLRQFIFFVFYLGFLLQPFTNYRTVGEEGGHSFNSSWPLPPASQALRH